MTPAGGKRLSKEEMDALLQHSDKNGAAADGGEHARRVESYDFFQPSRFNKSELERLRRINAGLAQTASHNLSGLLRCNVKMQLVSMEQTKWDNLLKEYGNSTMGYVFEMDPLGRHGIVTLDAQFAGACLERMMGGQPAVSSDEPEQSEDSDSLGALAAEEPEDDGPQADRVQPDSEVMSELESRIFSRFVRSILAPLPELWESIGEFSVKLASVVQDLQTTSLFPPSEDMFQLSLLMQSEFGSGNVALSVPFETIRSLPPASQETRPPGSPSDEHVESALRDSLQVTNLQFAVLLGAAEVSVRKLLELEPGDVLVLDNTIEDPLQVRINDKIKVRGYPGISAGRLAVKLIED